ncbi:MAG: sulfite exporter TauE/SafE family protein [Phycisphaerae bacterium]|nr:sulfite exporter TauE/SafE family protein [Phycisphaerae bacterium]
MSSLSPIQVGVCGLIGLGAGVLGGLAGVGGSILILPSLGVLFGYPRASSHHGYMASAMTVNLIVAIPAALRHHRAGAIRHDLLGRLIPATAITLAGGVIASNFFQGWQLQLLLALGLVLYCLRLLREAVRDLPEHLQGPGSERVTTPRLVASASATGFTAGLLGLGGGVLQVPLLQSLCGVPLRQAIATSSAVICLTAVVGAVLKLVTLPGEGEPVGDALIRAAAMAPTAILGAHLGASLTHRLHLHWVRIAIAVMLLVSAYRLGLDGGRMAGWWR